MKLLEKFVNALTGVEYWVTVPLFIVMLVVMLMQVVCRYILEIPLAFSEELARYLFVACTFLGAAIATAERGHIEINFVELAIGKFFKNPTGRMRAAILMNVLRDLGTAVCLALVTYETYYLVVDQLKMGQISTAMEIPLWIVTGSMGLGLALCILHSLALIVLNLAGRGPMGYEFAWKESNRHVSDQHVHPILFVVLSVLRIPIPFSAGLAGILCMLLGDIPLAVIPARMFGSVDSFAFLAIPAFIYSGDVMALGGITTAMITWVRSLTGRLKGSVAATAR